jgi:hypothetical protein
LNLNEKKNSNLKSRVISLKNPNFYIIIQFMCNHYVTCTNHARIKMLDIFAHHESSSYVDIYWGFEYVLHKHTIHMQASL